MTPQLFASLGALLAFCAVAAGSFGAHILKQTLSGPAPNIFNAAVLSQMSRAVTYEIAVRYQMYHALALFVTAWALTAFPHQLVGASGWLFVIGTLIFSGSLYLLSLTGVSLWGALTPVGGVILLIGWTCLFLGILFSKPSS